MKRLILHFAIRPLNNGNTPRGFFTLLESVSIAEFWQSFPSSYTGELVGKNVNQPLNFIYLPVVSFVPACVAKNSIFRNAVIELTEVWSIYRFKILINTNHPYGKFVGLKGGLGILVRVVNNKIWFNPTIYHTWTADRPRLVNPHQRLSTHCRIYALVRIMGRLSDCFKLLLLETISIGNNRD